MIVHKRETRSVDYQLTLTQREMAILAQVACNTAGRGDARFLYDLGEQVVEDPDLETDDVVVTFIDFGLGDACLGMVIDTGVSAQ